MLFSLISGCISLLMLTALSPAVDANNTKGTPAPVSTASNCHNVYTYNSFNAGPNKEIKTLLVEVKKQLAGLQKTVEEIKGNKTTVKEKNSTEPNKEIKTLLLEMKTQLAGLQKTVEEIKVSKKNCAELYKSGERISGVYTIDPDGLGAFDVFCDQTTAGGGWTVFQKRLDGSVDFYRGWADYKNGFGNLNGEFWLGLDKINRLTKSERYKLHVDLEDTKGKTAYAEYDHFAVTSETTKYKLSLGAYSGTAGDSLDHHRGFAFTTKDQDNDGRSGRNCALEAKGGWWYNDCRTANLNGLYHHGQYSGTIDGILWKTWKGFHYSAKRAEMKIRPEKF